jgi:hypothetical protein
MMKAINETIFAVGNRVSRAARAKRRVRAHAAKRASRSHHGAASMGLLNATVSRVHSGIVGLNAAGPYVEASGSLSADGKRAEAGTVYFTGCE